MSDAPNERDTASRRREEREKRGLATAALTRVLLRILSHSSFPTGILEGNFRGTVDKLKEILESKPLILLDFRISVISL